MKMYREKGKKVVGKVEKIDLVAKWSALLLGSLASFIFGGLTMMMAYLLYANILDFFTGWIAGAKTTGLESKKSYNGIKRKVVMWAAIAVAHIVDQVLGESVTVVLSGIDIGVPQHLLSEGHVIRDGVVILYLLNEVLSIIENVGKVAWVPSFLRKVVAVLKPAEDQKGE